MVKVSKETVKYDIDNDDYVDEDVDDEIDYIEE